jgi:hypothetical protein
LLSVVYRTKLTLRPTSHSVLAEERAIGPEASMMLQRIEVLL